MTQPNFPTEHSTRRNMLQMSAIGAGAALFGVTASGSAKATTQTDTSQAAFVYTEVQLSIPFDQAPWKRISDQILKQPGFISKTWLSGTPNNSVGGFYAFDTVANAQKFVTGYFPSEVREFSVGHTTRIFNANVVRDASIDMGSPDFGIKAGAKPGAFVYTEVQLIMPFEDMPWGERNSALQSQKGLKSKTWLSGWNTQTIGGFDAFDTIENATEFAVNAFPETAKKLNAAFYTRVFDANATEEASRYLNSPYYAAT
ncbi:YdhR family protein [Kiloniella antarctica]|uniref:YdhR family protein n=1 Tax=Kiloniella antarctica TaxID=1550907 RepID=A0ABW5BDI1_9PROT